VTACWREIQNSGFVVALLRILAFTPSLGEWATSSSAPPALDTDEDVLDGAARS
jgi:hypothetical protein